MGYQLLSPGIQRWIYKMGWAALRPVQERAVVPILAADRDVLIVAPTAEGKTEAAFLPILSRITGADEEGYSVLCLSPLKALINDQAQRFESLCAAANTSITAWHMDASLGKKKASWAKPAGVLMTTPESLEAMFIHRRSSLPSRFKNLQYIVIDEFHAFPGNPRGTQLISLLGRIERLVDRKIPRIALSATVGEPAAAIGLLRPAGGYPQEVVCAEAKSRSVKTAINGYVQAALRTDPDPTDLIAADLFRKLRGGKHLIFTSSRAAAELITDKLRGLSDRNCLPEEFHVHHGMLSAEHRRHVEACLKGNRPATAIATSTLELGIDVGGVQSVVQVGAPFSVASLRQRLGRSGRRGDASQVLRVCLVSQGRGVRPKPYQVFELGLVCSIAAIELLLEGWVEPAPKFRVDNSTLIQQILSVLAGENGSSASNLFAALVPSGPWSGRSASWFASLLKAMGVAGLIEQTANGELVLGAEGENLLSSGELYAAFPATEDLVVVANGKVLGAIPVDAAFTVGCHIIFAGMRWLVKNIDYDRREVMVEASSKGEPVSLEACPPLVHERVIRMMRSVLIREDTPVYCDATSADLLRTARKEFARLEIHSRHAVQIGSAVYWFIWADKKVVVTIAMALLLCHFDVTAHFVFLIVDDVIPAELIAAAHLGLQRLSSGMPIPQGKFDCYLDGSPEVLEAAYFEDCIDVLAAGRYLDEVSKIFSESSAAGETAVTEK